MAMAGKTRGGTRPSGIPAQATDTDSIISRAAPPPERGHQGPFAPVGTDTDSLARRQGRLLGAFGSRQAVARHAEGLGLSADAWLARFGDVRLEGPAPDWGCAFRELHDRLADTERPFAAVYPWARGCVEGAWPDGLPHDASALDGPIAHLEWRFRAVLLQTMRYEARLGAAGTTWAARFARSPALAYALGRTMADWRSASRTSRVDRSPNSASRRTPASAARGASTAVA